MQHRTELGGCGAAAAGSGPAPPAQPVMQAAERDGAAGSPEGVAGGGEAPPELSSPRAAAAFDLLELVRSYRRLELYLEPLRDAAEGVRSLLRYVWAGTGTVPAASGPSPCLRSAGGSGPCAPSSSASDSTSSCSPSAKVRVGGQGRSPPRGPRPDAVPPLLAAWYSVLALSVMVPALLGYLQEMCRARPSELELLRRRYHSVRREDLRKVQLSRQEAIAQVKSL